MSGGYFGYKQFDISDMADVIEQVISDNDNTETDKHGDVIGERYREDTIRRLWTACETLRSAAVFANRVDWLFSGDDGEDAFVERLNQDLHDLYKELAKRYEQIPPS